jgi:cell division protein ZipA
MRDLITTIRNFISRCKDPATRTKPPGAMSPHEPDLPKIGDLFLSPESQSAERASILPTEGTEDASPILGEITPPVSENEALGDYLPNPAVAWIVRAALEQPQNARELAAKFDQDRTDMHGDLTIYGRDIATGHWTFLVSGDGPEQVDGLQFAWDYFPSWSEDATVAAPSVYEARLQAVSVELSKFTESTVNADVSPTEAHKRAETLSTINDRFDRSVSIRLKAPQGTLFAGRDVWDVMLCLGLQWGDMDCFHWPNPSDCGDDFFFSVWTSSEPGYFLPEEVAEGRVNVADLIFGYSIPRSAAPATIYERMVKAVEYAQMRLGGTITEGDDGQPLDSRATEAEIREIADKLKNLGFAPGSDSALQQF